MHFKFVASLFVGLVSLNVWATSLSPYTTLTENIRSNNQVGFSLIQKTTEVDEATKGRFENVLISPVSAYVAFSMLHAGLRGDALDRLNQFMNLNPQENASFAQRNAELIRALSAERKSAVPARRGSPQEPIVGIYNSAWSTNGKTSGEPFRFNSQFLESLKHYGAAVHDVNMKSPQAALMMNDWANQKTRGLIPSIVNDDITDKLVWALMNATYVEANWAYEFYATPAAYSTPFHQLDGKQVQKDSVTSTASYRIVSTSEIDAIELPFFASDLAFYVVQPKSVATFKKLLSTGQLHSEKLWSKVVKGLEYPTGKNGSDAQVQLQMPKFSFPYSVTMRENDDLVSRLGLDFLFDNRSSPDFEPLGLLEIGPGKFTRSKVGIIKQDSKIELDENGVKAAAVTLIGGVAESAVAVPPVIIPFVVDKPFQFLIASKKTGAILFVGTVVEL